MVIPLDGRPQLLQGSHFYTAPLSWHLVTKWERQLFLPLSCRCWPLPTPLSCPGMLTRFYILASSLFIKCSSKYPLECCHLFPIRPHLSGYSPGFCSNTSRSGREHPRFYRALLHSFNGYTCLLHSQPTLSFLFTSFSVTMTITRPFPHLKPVFKTSHARGRHAAWTVYS